MKKKLFLTWCLSLSLFFCSFSQRVININNSFSKDTVLSISDTIPSFYAFRIKCSTTLLTDSSLVRIILKTNIGNEYLLFENYTLINNSTFSNVDHFAEETYYLPATYGDSVFINTIQASVFIDKFEYYTTPFNNYSDSLQTHLISVSNQKINEINNKIKDHQMLWFAGHTIYSSLSYELKKSLFGKKYNIEGWEFYSGGFYFQLSQMKNANKSTSSLIEEFDWRKKHNANNYISPYYDEDPDSVETWYFNSAGVPVYGYLREYGNGWMTSVKNQLDNGDCPNGCYAFAPISTIEAISNLYFNKHIDYNLSEQEAISCGYELLNAGTCWDTSHHEVNLWGGFQNRILNLIRDYGVSSETCLVWADSMVSCSEGCNVPSYILRIPSYTLFTPGNVTSQNDKNRLKEYVINNGPLGFAMNGHAMCMLGFGKIREGQILHSRNGWGSQIVVNSNNPLIGATYWIIKNSAGPGFGDGGYNYLVDNNTVTNQSIMGSFYRINTPIIDTASNDTVFWADLDGDGYYNWGIGTKPASCPTTLAEDCNDADPLMGPADTNYVCSCNCDSFTYSSTPIEILQNETWNDYKYINRDIHVNSGDTLAIGAKIGFQEEAGIVVEDGGTLILNDGCVLYSICDTTWKGIDVNGGGTLITNNNSEVLLTANGRIFIDSDVNGEGSFYYNAGSYISLYNDSTNIDIKGSLVLGDSAIFSFDGNGYLKLSSNDTLSDNIIGGIGSQIILNGNGQNDVVIEIAQESMLVPVEIDTFSITNAKVYLQNNIARLAVLGGNTVININNINFTPQTSSRTGHRGLQLFGQINVTLSDCNFENGYYGIYGYLTYNGASLTVSGCTFVNCNHGIWINDKSLIVSNSTFTDCSSGVYTQATSFDNNEISECVFDSCDIPVRHLYSTGDLYMEYSNINYANTHAVSLQGSVTFTAFCNSITGVSPSNAADIYAVYNVVVSLGNNLSVQGGYNELSTSGCQIIVSAANMVYMGYGHNKFYTNGSTYKLYGTLTYSVCGGKAYVIPARANQWYDNTNSLSSSHYLLAKNGCTNERYTVDGTQAALYSTCEGDGMMSSNETEISEVINEDLIGIELSSATAEQISAENNQDWQSVFNSFIDVFDNVGENNTEDIEIWERAWRGVTHSLKQMYLLKQIQNNSSYFSSAMQTLEKMKQICANNSSRLFFLEVEKATLFRLNGDYEAAIEVLENVLPLSESENVENYISRWICIINIDKDIRDGIIIPANVQTYSNACEQIDLNQSSEKNMLIKDKEPHAIFSELNLTIQPNPVTQQSIISINLPENATGTIEIISSEGKTHKTYNVTSKSSIVSINANELPKGVYTVKAVSSSGEIKTTRMIIQ